MEDAHHRPHDLFLRPREAPPEGYVRPVMTASASREETHARFTALYREHWEYVWRCLRCMWIADKDLPDATQKVFVQVYRQIEHHDPKVPVRAWLFGFARNIVREQRRAHRRKGGLDALPEDDLFADEAPDPAARAERAEALREAAKILGQLTPERREVFIMTERLDMTAAEIGAALGVSPNTISSRLGAARRDVNEIVARHHRRPT